MRALILCAGAALALAGCTTAQRDRVESTASAICASLPLAQAAYNVAVQSGSDDRVNFVMTTINAFCPTLLAGIQLVPVRVPAAPPVPVPTPERG